MNCPHDYENDDCTNCANGLPPFHCLMNDEETKVLPSQEELLERAYQQGRADERAKVIKILENNWLKGSVARRIIDEIIEQIKEQTNE